MEKSQNDIFKKSIDCNKSYLCKHSREELDKRMKEFDNLIVFDWVEIDMYFTSLETGKTYRVKD